MKEFLVFILLFAGYVFVMKWALPKMGVPT